MTPRETTESTPIIYYVGYGSETPDEPTEGWYISWSDDVIDGPYASIDDAIDAIGRSAR